MTNPPTNLPELSVSELSNALKRTVEDRFSHVRVRGEISGFKRHSSGHLYFALKDADAVMDAVCWRGQAGKIALRPEDGMEVIATGRLTTYPGRSKYQMNVEHLELAGQGALLKLLEDRKQKLAAEGLFAPERKRPIPFLPNVIGVVTSPTGAVIRDILHRLNDRFPRHVLVWPVAVQGDGAAEQVARAINGFNDLAPNGLIPRPDVLIVARGGGSIEDLWAFNEEVVVRAAANSAIPLISAVGHETDTTLIDYASDLRAPTPTAAAEKAVPVRADLLATTADYQARLVGAVTRHLGQSDQRLQAMARALPNPKRLVEDNALKLDDRAERLSNALPNLLERRQAQLQNAAARLRHPRDLLGQKSHMLAQVSARLMHAMEMVVAKQKSGIERGQLLLDQRIERLKPGLDRCLDQAQQHLNQSAKLLESYSYHSILARGFAVVRNADGALVDPTLAKTGDQWQVEFAHRSLGVTVGENAEMPPQTPPNILPKEPTKSPKKKRPDDDRQGTFL